MATIDDLVNAQAYRRAAMAEGLAMGKEIPPGKGGSPGQPYEPDKTGPFVPSPRKKPNNMMIAHHREHFGDGGGDDLMKKIMSDPTLDESDYKRILGPDYEEKMQQYQQQSMLISGAQDLDSKTNPLQDGSFLDEDGNRYLWSPREQKFLDMGPYDPDIHGLPMPLAKKKNKMTIA